MNAPIRRLFGVMLLLMLLLVGSTSWWTVVRADDLNTQHANQNPRAILRGEKVPRGAIRAADGTVLARSLRDDEGVYQRTYPEGELFGHPLGYSYTRIGQTELEQHYEEDLGGRESDAESLVDQVLGRAEGGDELRTNLDVGAQRLATQLIQQAAPEEGGAAVALDPETGAVKVMASVPGYDPNDVDEPRVLGRLNQDEGRKPLVNRALQFGYAPGSTFKVLTMVAALDSGRFRADSQVDGTDDVRISGVPLGNDFGESFGRIDLKTALTKSVNTAFAQVAQDVGRSTMRDYMERFGFDKKPQLDYPRDAMSASGVYRDGELTPVTDGNVDLGRVGIGQERLQVTPLQMAQVAAAVANEGKLMKPRLASRLVDRDGRTSRTIEPEVQSQVMSKETAATVKDAMVSVVQSGTGTLAQLPGIQVAGKTGTAETEVGRNQKNKLWFIALAPAENPRVAIAVTVNEVVGFGGAVAAPIAKQVIQELLK